MRHIEEPDRPNTRDQRIGMMRFAYIICFGLCVNAAANLWEGTAQVFGPEIRQLLGALLLWIGVV